VLALGACTAYKTMVGENTVTLQGAEVLSMRTDIRRPVKRICPREPVQMWVRVEARLEDQNSPVRLETWVGDRDARRNGFLDFGNFVFTSGQGTVDEHGWYHPRRDMLATADQGYQVQSAFRYRPDRFSETFGSSASTDACARAAPPGRRDPQDEPGATGGAGPRTAA
jgi:hypothetical protein